MSETALAQSVMDAAAPQSRDDVELSRQELKALYARSDTLGLAYFGGWLLLTIGAGFLLYSSLGTPWVVPAMLVYGAILVFAYAMSHETSHGTAFRTRWLNEAVFWFTSLIYGQEPTYRRFSHASHHTHTWIRGRDAQKAWDHPLTLGMYMKEISGWNEIVGFPRTVLQHAAGHIPDSVKAYTPETQRPRLVRGARLFLGFHVALVVGFALAGLWWVPLVFFYLPRVLGGPLTNNVFDITQHAEMKDDAPDVRESTRSVKTTRLTNFIYSNMSHHVEHHLYPMVPFHALPALNRRIREQLPDPAPGFYHTNLQILRAIFSRMRAADPAERARA